MNCRDRHTVRSVVELHRGLTGIGTIVLATYRHCRFGRLGLYLLALIYAALLGYHTTIFLSGV